MNFRILLVFLLLIMPFSVSAAPGVGEPAPDFELSGSDGNTWSLAQFKGEKPVVIAFFPKAFTGG